MKPLTEAPERRCQDCAHDLQTDPFSACWLCPMFGQDRAGVTVRCEAFEPRQERRLSSPPRPSR